MKFNLSKFSGSEKSYSLIKEAGAKDILMQLKEPVSGKTYSAIFSEVIPGETPENRKARIQNYKEELESMLKDPILNAVLNMPIVEKELKTNPKYSKNIGTMLDLRKALSEIFIDKIVPLFREAAQQATSKLTDEEKQIAVVRAEEWVKGVNKFLGKSDYSEKIIIFFSNAIRFLKDKDKLALQGGLEYADDKVEAMLHENSPASFTLTKYKTSGEKDVHTLSQESASTGDCGFKPTKASKWVVLYGKTTHPDCFGTNSALWQKYSPPSWCTSRGSASGYLSSYPKIYLLNFGGGLSSAACVVNQSGVIKELVNEYNKAPFEYHAYVKELIEKEGIKHDNNSKFGYYGPQINVRQAFEWVEKNKNMSDDQLMKNMERRIVNLINKVDKHNNIIELVADLGDVDANSEDIDYLGSKAIFGDRLKQPEIIQRFKDLVQSKLRSKSASNRGVIKVAQSARNREEVIMEYVFYNFNLPSPKSESAIARNIRSLLNNKSLPKEAEDLMFKDDNPETLKAVIDQMVYGKI